MGEEESEDQMTNRQIVSLLPHIRREFRKETKLRRALEKQVSICNTLQSVSRVVNGIAIRTDTWSSFDTVRSMGKDIHRTVEIRRRVAIRGYCVTCENGRRKGLHALYIRCRTRKAAMALAIRWVTTGKVDER